MTPHSLPGTNQRALWNGVMWRHWCHGSASTHATPPIGVPDVHTPMVSATKKKNIFRKTSGGSKLTFFGSRRRPVGHKKNANSDFHARLTPEVSNAQKIPSCARGR